MVQYGNDIYLSYKHFYAFSTVAVGEVVLLAIVCVDTNGELFHP